MSRRRHRFVMVLPLLLGLLVAVWGATRAHGNFDADEAVFGLVARDAADGRLAAFMYGQRYLGTLEALLGAVSMRIFGESIVSLRVGAVALYAGFLALHAVLLRRTWGRIEAAAALALLAVPPLLILKLVVRPVGAFSALLFFGAAALLLAGWSPRDRRAAAARSLALGAVAGIGLWSHPMMSIFLVAIVGSRVLGTPEWRRMHDALGRLGSRVRVPVDLLCVMAGALVAFLAFFAYFAAGCAEGSLLSALHAVARRALPVVALLAAGSVWFVSRRRREILRGAGLLVVGGMVGWAPAWTSWIATGSAPSAAVLPSCPDGIPVRLSLVVKRLIPTVWGVVPDVPRGRTLDVAAAFILGVIAVGIVLFVGQHRRTLTSALLLRPTASGEDPTLTWFLLWTVPIALSVFGANTFDLQTVRYLIVTWLATSVIVAVALVRLPWRAISLCAIAVLVAAVATSTYTRGIQEWRTDLGRFHPSAVGELETFLRANEVEGGYAEYWTAYPLTFLIPEPMVLSPFATGRHPPFAVRAAGLERFAVVLDIGAASDTPEDVAALRDFVTASFPVDDPEVRSMTGRVVRRENVAHWDVWVVDRASTGVAD